jgi:hypothetical protein
MNVIFHVNGTHLSCKVEIFDKIEDATIFIFWKFARWLDDPQAFEHQVSFALVNTTNAFPNVVELRKSLTQSKHNLTLKWSDMYSTRPNKRARNKVPVSNSEAV